VTFAPDNPPTPSETQAAATPPAPVTLSEPLNSAPEIVPASPALRDPAWNGWDVLRIFFIAIFLLFATVLALFAFVSGSTFRQRADRLSAIPELLLGAQMVAYLALLGYMYILVTRERRRPRFWESIRWNWPTNFWPYLFGGFGLQAVLLVLEHYLPFPGNTPFEALLKRPLSVVLIAVFSVSLGPLMEELFFRAFLYPVLARRIGVSAGIGVTAAGFALLHAAQYGYSWASVMLILIVGVVLGWVREHRNSVAASFLVHVAYNGTIIVLMFSATGGFRHMERLNQ
jgi:uncharacterized protein